MYLFPLGAHEFLEGRNPVLLIFVPPIPGTTVHSMFYFSSFIGKILKDDAEYIC
jgi:hypothetical protein